jgi:uncharacterized protein
MQQSTRSGNLRAWQRMLSGRRLDLLNPDPADIEIEDIAHGLARVARWNGQTQGEHAFSVAQHSLLVEEIAGQLMLPAQHSVHQAASRWPLAALLHDAPEYVVGDLISPFKAAIGYDYKVFEHRLLAAVHQRFEVPDPVPDAVTAIIKQADGIAAYLEATALAGFSVAEADAVFGRPTLLAHWRPAPLTPWPTAHAQAAFIKRFRALTPGLPPL